MSTLPAVVLLLSITGTATFVVIAWTLSRIIHDIKAIREEMIELKRANTLASIDCLDI